MKKHIITQLSFLLLLSCFNIYAQTEFNDFIPSVEKSIWKICSSLIMSCRTGFFIDKETFVTNLHVVDDFILQKRLEVNRPLTLAEFKLTQNGSQETLQIKSIKSLSIPYDLTVLKIKGTVENYLSLNKSSPDKSESLYSISYANNSFRSKLITKAYKFGNIYYQNTHFYRFIAILQSKENLISFNRFRGASGSPILNINGSVVGVLSNAIFNSLEIKKIGLLNEMQAGRDNSQLSYIHCKDSVDINACFLSHYYSLMNFIEQLDDDNFSIDQNKTQDTRHKKQAYIWTR